MPTYIPLSGPTSANWYPKRDTLFQAVPPPEYLPRTKPM